MCLLVLETRIIGLHFAADSMGLSSLSFLVGSVKPYIISARVTFWSFKVIQGHCFLVPIESAYAILVHHSNFGPTLHRFRDIAGAPPDPPFHPNFWGRWTRSPMLGSRWTAIRLWNYFRSIPPVWKTYLNVTDRQTDGWTDAQTDWHDDILWHNRALRSIAW